MKRPVSISSRKKEHIDLCLNKDVSFRRKTNGIEQYDFEHYAITEVDLDSIDLSVDFFKHKINYPFLISCMTGGTLEAKDINYKLAEAASTLNIPVGVGSQRQVLENDDYLNSYKLFKQFAEKIPVLANIGAAQVAALKNIDPISRIIDMISAHVLVIHVNPLQELIQSEGDRIFSGLLKSIEKICAKINYPIIVKEVGAGISKRAAKKLLDAGVKGIDVAGAGGTSWAGIEMLRNKTEPVDEYFWDWGLPTSFCIKEVSKLKKKYDFILIGSGGINNYDHIAKALVLGADITASARIVLQKCSASGCEGVIEFVEESFKKVKMIMFLTGVQTLRKFHKLKLIKRKNLC